MILQIIKSYFTILLSIGSAALLVLVAGLYVIFRQSFARKLVTSSGMSSTESHTLQSQKRETTPAIRDLSDISGDDVFSTQLDLARAYIETGKKDLAKGILKHVEEQGNPSHKQEAQQLMIQM